MRRAIEHYQYVAASARTGSFRRAAEICDVGQSNITRAIQQLESSLGVKLFERFRTGVRLTPAGREFLIQAGPPIEELERIRMNSRAIRRGRSGVLRLGLLTSLSGGLLRHIVGDFIKKHPSIALNIRDGGRKDHFAWIGSRSLDAAIVTGFEGGQPVMARQLWDERVYVAMSETHPLTALARLDWPDLAEERFLVTHANPGPDVREFISRRAKEYGFDPDVEVQPAVQETLMNLVALGLGITVVSAAWAAVRVPGLVFRPLNAAEDQIPFSLIWSPQNDNPALHRFVALAEERAARAARLRGNFEGHPY